MARSTHASRIFQNSNLCIQQEDQPVNGYLINGNGYACINNLLTPILYGLTPAEQRYNAAYKTHERLKTAFPLHSYKIKNKTSDITCDYCCSIHYIK